LSNKLIQCELKNVELKSHIEREQKIGREWKEKFEEIHTKFSSLQNSLKKFLNDDQLKVINGAARVNWSDESISKALSLKLRCGNNGLDYASTHVVPLPASRTVRRHVESMKFLPGIQELPLKMLKIKCDTLPVHQKYFQIVFDEKSITPGSYFDPSTKTHLGISTLEPTDAHLKNNPDAITTHVLVFQVVGLTTRFKEIASFEYTSYSLEKSQNLKDNESEKETFIKLIKEKSHNENQKKREM
jgi:Transposase protein